MYLPTEDPTQRQKITTAFDTYKKHCERKLWPVYGAVEHWAKIEEPTTAEDAAWAQARLAAKFQTSAFAAARDVFDPKNILSNALLDKVLPRDAKRLRSMRFTVPDGYHPGQTVPVQTPDGNVATVLIPNGCAVGSVLTVSY